MHSHDINIFIQSNRPEFVKTQQNNALRHKYCIRRYSWDNLENAFFSQMLSKHLGSVSFPQRKAAQAELPVEFLLAPVVVLVVLDMLKSQILVPRTTNSSGCKYRWACRKCVKTFLHTGSQDSPQYQLNNLLNHGGIDPISMVCILVAGGDRVGPWELSQQNPMHV